MAKYPLYDILPLYFKGWAYLSDGQTYVYLFNRKNIRYCKEILRKHNLEYVKCKWVC